VTTITTKQLNCKIGDIEVLEEDYSSEWASIYPTFTTHKKKRTIMVGTDLRKPNLLLKPIMSPISYSKHRGHDPFNGRVTLVSVLNTIMGYYHIRLDADA
jgi:hypothetical protein